MTGPRLLELYDYLLLDLDGTLYHGPRPIASAVAALADVRTPIAYVTNNASRSPAEVASALTGMRFQASPDQVVTSAQAAAELLAARLPKGSAILVVGSEALVEEIRLRDLVPVREFAAGLAGVVQGHSPDTGWRQLAEAALAIRAGALWVACNVDPTLPTERGLLPGNGSMVAALRTATDAEPLVAGKPEPPLLEAALRRHVGDAPLVVGDRLDTDIAGANAVGAASLLVFTGVSTPAEVARAPEALRPTYVAADLSALHRPARSLLFDAWLTSAALIG